MELILMSKDAFNEMLNILFEDKAKKGLGKLCAGFEMIKFDNSLFSKN